jgi:translation initiation factor 1A
MFGVADQMMGGSRIRVLCADGRSRLARIPGKLKKRLWIRPGDLVIVKPWESQDEKADVIWRFKKSEAAYLSRKKMLPGELDIF